MKGLQFLSLLMIGSLFAITGLRQFFVEPLASTLPNLIWFGVQVAPLLMVLPGMLGLQPRNHFFGVLAAMLYFVHGVMEVSTPDLRVMALWEIGFACGLVTTATLTMRRLNRAPAQ
jgi:uncharacterized membrane protein